MHSGHLGSALRQLLAREPLVPGQSQLVQQRKAGLEVTEGVPGLAQGQMALRYLPQAQGVRAVGSLGLECLRRLPVCLDSRLGAAQAGVAVAEQVEEICLVMRLLSGRPTPGILHAVPRCHGGPSEDGCPLIRPASVTNLSTMLISPSARTGIP